MRDILSLYQLYLRHPVVFTDSRKVKKGGIFFALKGENFDGNQFAQMALDSGAAHAVVDDPALGGKKGMILVEDSLSSLQELARHHRRQFDIPFIGITGSNGKTTTKELVGAVLKKKYRTYYTQGNLNNHIGVPLTILSIPQDSELVVVEMGANHQGEIAFLSRIAQPTHGLITNIGKAHLEGFGGIEGVKKGKSELYRYLARQEGLVFINKSEAFLEGLAAPVDRKVFYENTEEGVKSRAGYYAMRFHSSDPFVKMSFVDMAAQEWTIRSRLPGRYNLGNMMTAVALGLFFEVPSPEIIQAVEDYLPQNNRSQILKQGSNTIVLDAYNANPTSMKGALLNFQKMEGDNKIAILGDMLELGQYAGEEHRQTIRQARQIPLQQLILVGPEFSKIKENGLLTFNNVEEAKKWWRVQHFEGATILIKGSRGIGLERLLN